MKKIVFIIFLLLFSVFTSAYYTMDDRIIDDMTRVDRYGHEYVADERDRIGETIFDWDEYYYDRYHKDWYWKDRDYWHDKDYWYDHDMYWRCTSNRCYYYYEDKEYWDSEAAARRNLGGVTYVDSKYTIRELQSMRAEEREYEWTEYDVHDIRQSVREGTQITPRQCSIRGCEDETIDYGPRQYPKYELDETKINAYNSITECGRISSSVRTELYYGGEAGDYERSLVKPVEQGNGIDVVKY